MKDMTRAYRRYKKWVKFKKRVDNWTCYHGENRVRDEFREEILEGVRCTWLRTTGRPCNCWMCSGEYKYVRPPKDQIQKEMWEEYLNFLDNSEELS